MLGGVSSNAEVVEGVRGVPSNSAGDQSQIDAFGEAPVLAAQAGQAGGQIGGKKRKRRRRRRQSRKSGGKAKKDSTKKAPKKKSAMKRRKKHRTHRTKGYKMTLRRM
jgi:hypothetical protein